MQERRMGSICLKAKDRTSHMDPEYPELSDTDLEFLLRNTGLTEPQIKNKHYSVWKKLKGNTLTPESFEEVFKLFFPLSDSAGFRQEVFSTFDPAKKDWIDFSEFVQAVNILSTRALYEQLGTAFLIFDRNNSGEIDKEEMLDVIAYLAFHQGKNIKPLAMIEMVDRIFNAVDEDGNGVLTKEEFLNGCLSCKEMAALLQTV